MTVLDPEGLRDASGQVFYNTSKFTLKTLVDNPSQLEANFNYYLDDEVVQEIRDLKAETVDRRHSGGVGRGRLRSTLIDHAVTGKIKCP